jgi:hypothetical protein
MAPTSTRFGLEIDATRRRRAFLLPRILAPVLLALALAASPAAAVTNVTCAPNGSVTLANPNPPLLGSTVTAVPTFGVIEQSISGGQFVVKKVGDPISWAANSLVNYRDTNAAAATDSFSLGGFVFNVTIQSGQPPTPTTTTTSDVTITYSANDQAIGVSAQVTPIPPSGTVTFAIPGAGSNASAVVNPQGIASGNFVVKGGTPSGNYPITATFNGPANYASSSGAAVLHINFFTSVTAPASVATTYSPAANNLTLSASVTSPFGGNVNAGTVKFTVMLGANVVGSVASAPVISNSASTGYALPAGAGVGAYSITAEYSGGGNILPSSGQASLTVDKKNQSISFGPLGNVPYGVPPFALAATGGGSGNPIVFSVTSGPGSIQGNMLTVTGTGVIIIQATQAGNANYNPTQTSQMQTVSPAPLTVTALPQTRAYGAPNPPLTFTAAPFVNGDTIATALTGALLTASPSIPVGAYPIKQGTLAAANYAINFIEGKLTVTKAMLTVSADSLSKMTGTPNPSLTYSFAGFVNGDDEGALSGAPALSTTATNNSAPGDYPIAIAAGSLGAGNYDFNLVPGVLHVVVVPGSHVDAVDSAGCGATDLTVHWSRTDGGSGEVTYTVFVSENQGPFKPFITDTKETSAPFSGTVGTTYAFYSQLRDQFGHVEDPPAAPDFTSTIAACTTTTSSTTTSTSSTSSTSPTTSSTSSTSPTTTSTSSTSSTTSSTSSTGPTTSSTSSTSPTTSSTSSTSPTTLSTSSTTSSTSSTSPTTSSTSSTNPTTSSTSSTSPTTSSTSSTTSTTASTSTTSSTLPTGTADLAVIRIKTRKVAHLTPGQARSLRVKVQVENRGEQAETVDDAVVLSEVVQLGVNSLGATCSAPSPSLHLGRLQQKFPLTLAPKRRLQVVFDVSIDCANDDAKGAGHEDYALTAWVDHQALGSADAHSADDECPRPAPLPGEVEPFLGGTIVDKGCGARNGDGTLGAPILLDVVVNP